VVWNAAQEAANDLLRLAPLAVPAPFTKRQADADAKEMFSRYLKRDLKSNIPKALPSAPATALPPPGEIEQALLPRLPVDKIKVPKIPVEKIPIPKLPRLPKLPSGKTLLYLLLAYLALKD
jgi:hypothetical protein